jgi:hypothetical protein
VTAPRFDRLAHLVGRLWSPFDERINPILVKEVRQALRGRYFMVIFWLTLVAAMLVGSGVILYEGSDPSEIAGIRFFSAMLFCLSYAIHLFVPLSAFLSLGGEWDENTHDLLVITNLRPGQIVLGKLLSAGVQVLLFYSALGPFLVFAFLLHGLDLVAAAWALGSLLLTSLALVAIALALSSITSIKIIRIFILAFLAAHLVGAGFWLAFPWVALVHEPGVLHEPDFQPIILGTLIGVVGIGAFALVFAAARLAHPEENRSSALRILTTIVILVGIGWIWYLYGEIGHDEVLLTGTLILGGVLAVMSTFFLTEEEALGRRVRLQVPRSPLLGLITSPWFPGGGRGVLFLLVHLGLILAAMLLAPRWMPGGVTGTIEAWRQVSVGICLYLFVYLALPTVLFAPLTRKIHWRVTARFAVPAFIGATVFLPLMYGFFFEKEEILDGKFLANPGWMVYRVVRKEEITGTLLAMGVVVGVVLLLNSWRVGRALREGTAASARGRELDALDRKSRSVSEEGDAVSEV